VFAIAAPASGLLCFPWPRACPGLFVIGAPTGSGARPGLGRARVPGGLPCRDLVGGFCLSISFAFRWA
jgi:hypothetical protein